MTNNSDIGMYFQKSQHAATSAVAKKSPLMPIGTKKVMQDLAYVPGEWKDTITTPHETEESLGEFHTFKV